MSVKILKRVGFAIALTLAILVWLFSLHDERVQNI